MNQQFFQSPKILLWIDLIGAATTALATFFLLAKEMIPTGISFWILCAMSLVAGGFAFFDLLGLALAPDPRLPLKVIAILNTSYCVAVACICWINSANLTMLGSIYFAIESAVVLPLAFWEWHIANRIVRDGSRQL